jgi:hypothetical protein
MILAAWLSEAARRWLKPEPSEAADPGSPARP